MLMMIKISMKLDKRSYIEISQSHIVCILARKLCVFFLFKIANLKQALQLLHKSIKIQIMMPNNANIKLMQFASRDSVNSL